MTNRLVITRFSNESHLKMTHIDRIELDMCLGHMHKVSCKLKKIKYYFTINVYSINLSIETLTSQQHRKPLTTCVKPEHGL